MIRKLKIVYPDGTPVPDHVYEAIIARGEYVEVAEFPAAKEKIETKVYRIREFPPEDVVRQAEKAFSAEDRKIASAIMDGQSLGEIAASLGTDPRHVYYVASRIKRKCKRAIQQLRFEQIATRPQYGKN